MSKLKFVKPIATNRKAKILLYGNSGTGKSTLSLQFPKPAVIYSELKNERDQYVDVINARGGMWYATGSFSDMFDQVKALATETHDFKSLVIDSLSTYYLERLEYHGKSSTAHGSHYKKADDEFDRFFNFIQKIDMHVILTARSSDFTETPDGKKPYQLYKNSNYLMDLIINTRVQDKKYIGVIKNNTIKKTATDEEVELTYQNIVNLLNDKSFSENVKPLILVDKETLKNVENLISQVGWSEQKVYHEMTRAGITSLDELTEDKANAWINFLTNLVSKRG